MEEDWVLYGCTRAKAAAVASVKLEIGQGEGEGFKPLPATDPMVRLFKKPNRATSWAMMMEAIVSLTSPPRKMMRSFRRRE